MEDGSLSGIVTLLWLLALHATIALAYAALTNAHRNLLREQAEQDNRHAKLAIRVLEDSARLHITYQLSIVIVNFAIAVIATLSVVQPLLANIEVTASPSVIYAVVLLPTLILNFILGELVPAAVGQAHANRLVSMAVYPLRWLTLLLIPFVAVLVAISKLISSPFDSDEAVNSITHEEIMTLVDAGQKGGTIEDEEKEMIYSVLQLDQTLAREVMVPRIDVVALDVKTPVRDALSAFIRSGYSRIPAYEDTIDNIKGLLYAKDLLEVWKDGDSGVSRAIGEFLRPAYFIPETKKADALLKELQNQNIHMAMVVDEYGGTAGLVTIENLIEEIIGDIRDEFDANEEVEYVELSPEQFVTSASMDLDDFNELLEVELPTEENDTLGGFIYSQLGRVPRVGDTIERDDVILRVEGVEGRRIRKVLATRKVKPESDTAATDITATPRNGVPKVVTPDDKSLSLQTITETE